ncbi:MFS transporter [Pseudomonas sp. TH31]|uniref:MFS transporter n=1 Tax=Pseudomonas sp. TH31 TaxID=2796396 RepID=UPI0019146150|nr:MFS transporter [Pseudomonas sp. TH31]MBK5418096.1 MFS transporter [Pseudomonas sp. TH31]
MPAVMIMYTISFFDRANIAMALPYMAVDLNLTPVEAGWIGAAFAWGYVITQVLGAFLALRFGSRRLIGWCLFLFGAAAIATGFARTSEEIMAMRFILGLAEGPIYAAVSMLLAQWFIKPERGRAFGIWNLAVPLGGFLAGPVSGAILAHYDWRLMLIIEGVPAWLFCLVWFVMIPPNLQAAKWLPDADRNAIEAELAAEQNSHGHAQSDTWWKVFNEPVVWLLTLGFGLSNILLYGITLWLPTILKSYSDLNEFVIGVLSGAPFLMTMLGVWYITRRSDRHNQERRLHAAIPTVITGLIMLCAAFVPTHLYWLQIALFIAMGFTLKMLTPLVFSRLTEIFPIRKAIPAVAVVSGEEPSSANSLARFWLDTPGPSLRTTAHRCYCWGSVLLPEVS